jgi:hypothetical protein
VVEVDVEEREPELAGGAHLLAVDLTLTPDHEPHGDAEVDHLAQRRRFLGDAAEPRPRRTVTDVDVDLERVRAVVDGRPRQLDVVAGQADQQRERRVEGHGHGQLLWGGTRRISLRRVGAVSTR